MNKSLNINLVKQKSKLVERFDFVFWSGDFNYRVNQTRENTIKFLKEKNYEVRIWKFDIKRIGITWRRPNDYRKEEEWSFWW